MSNKEKEIRFKEITIFTLQCQCEDPDIQLQSANNTKVQDESLISQLEEQKCALKYQVTTKERSIK